MRIFVALLLAYVGVRLSTPFGMAGEAVAIIALGACYASLPKGWRIREDRGAWAELLPWLMVGVLSWLFVLTFARDLFLLFAAALLQGSGYEQWVRDSAIAVVAAVPLITAAGFFMARREAPVVKVDIPVRDLPAGLEGFTIAQISDIHVGPTIKRPFVEKIVDRVNRLGADMVAITGDIVDGTVRELSHHTEPLARLDSRHGTYAVTGNHEYYSGAPEWILELRRLGANVLLNEHVVIDHDGAALTLAGVTDYSAHHFDAAQRSDPALALRGAPANGTKVLLAHQPRSANAAASAGFDLQLSGHTHGGQFWPWNLFVRLQQPFTAGLNRLGQMWVYINRGTGYWGPPMRFGIPSEITHIRLVRANATES